MSLAIRFLVLLSIPILVSCGVKGKPQPPLEAPVLGRGEYTPPKKTQDSKAKKKSKNSEPDWEEADDFEDNR